MALVAGAPLYLNAVENDLEGRVLAAAIGAEPSVNGVSFDGQDGTVFCVTPLDYPASLVETLEEIHGVRTITADRTCRVLRAPTVDPNLPVPATIATTTTTTGPASSSTSTTSAPSTTTTTTTIAEPGTEGDRIVDQLASDPELTTIARIVESSGRISGEPGPIILLAPVDGAFDMLGPDLLADLLADPVTLDALIDRHLLDAVDSDRVRPDGDNIIIDGSARLIDDVDVGSSSIWLIDTVLSTGEIGIVPTFRLDLALDSVTLSGSLADSAATTRFRMAAEASALPVTTSLTPQEGVTITVGTIGGVERLIRGVVTLLETATLIVNDEGITLVGTHTDEGSAQAVEALARVLDAQVTITPRPPMTQAELDRLNDVISELVSSEPIAFESGSARIVAGTDVVLEQIATIAARNPELDMIVRGHTDGAGVPASNLTLSAARAEAVVAALINLDIDPGRLTAQGIGSAEPIIVDGIEDAERSRRVEFVLVGG